MSPRRISSSMARARPQEYTQPPPRSSANPWENLSSWLRQGSDMGSSPVAVVVRNPTSGTDSASESVTPGFDDGEQNERDRSEENRRTFRGAPETSPYHMPIPQDTAPPRAGEENRLGPSPSEPETRGTKRAHEPDADADAERRAPRRHGKRLTTREEVSLFAICNRHAGSFGRRSDICNWWKTVAEEFTETFDRPYSWHSVRRKVEMVTKQRIKFLEDRQRRQDLDQEMMNPEWCAVLDEWTPTWQRWEESEARRIQQRDDMMRRRSRSRRDILETEARMANWASDPDRIDAEADHIHHEDIPSEAADEPSTLSSPIPTPATTSPAMNPARVASGRMPNTVRMPPGFETMFSDSRPSRPHTPPPISNPKPPSDGPMVNAVIETLGKLNRHLDAATGSTSREEGPSPIVSAVGRVAADTTNPTSASNRESEHEANISPSISLDLARIKEELQQEMHAELVKHRAEVHDLKDKLAVILQLVTRILRER